jgi:DinB superfamily
MSQLSAARDENQRSVTEFLVAAREIEPSAWGREAAPGKWSPAQVTEHVALAYERTRELLTRPPGRGIPRLFRLLIRHFYVRPILKNGRFPSKAKAPKPFQPSGAPPLAEALCARLEAAAHGLEEDFEGQISAGKEILDHPVFGRVNLVDALRFQAIHTAHHRRQLPTR